MNNVSFQTQSFGIYWGQCYTNQINVCVSTIDAISTISGTHQNWGSSKYDICGENPWESNTFVINSNFWLVTKLGCYSWVQKNSEVLFMLYRKTNPLIPQ